MLVFINTMGFALNPRDIPGAWKVGGCEQLGWEVQKQTWPSGKGSAADPEVVPWCTCGWPNNNAHSLPCCRAGCLLGQPAVPLLQRWAACCALALGVAALCCAVVGAARWVLQCGGKFLRAAHFLTTSSPDTPLPTDPTQPNSLGCQRVHLE